jgi:hypothetical protein
VVVGIRPRNCLGVVELELDVGRHPSGLDRRHVGADDLGARMLVGEISRCQPCKSSGREARETGNGLHCPDTGSRANVDNPLWVGVDRAVVELVVVQNEEHLVAGGDKSVLALIKVLTWRGTHFRSSPSFCVWSLGALLARQAPICIIRSESV